MATRREELYPEIKRLREVEGLMWREIGEALGLSKSTVFDYYNDPTGALISRRKKESDERTRATCPKCGGLMSPRRMRYSRCSTCYGAELSVAHRERMDDIASLWNEGATLAEIKAYMGYAENSSPPILSEMIALGLIEARRAGYRRKHQQQRDAA